MGIANGLTIPNNIANGNALDAPTAMANWNALLVALNRALLDAGNGNGMSAAGSQIHNLGAGSVSSDAVKLGQLTGYLPLTGGTLTGPLAATAGLTAVTQAVNDNTTAVATDAFVQAQLAASLAAYLPLLGGTLTGPLATKASTAATAGLGIPPGVAPATPTNGDIWMTAKGLFARVAGTTLQFLGVPSTRAWQNLTASRASGTQYTNTTNYDIEVLLVFPDTAGASAYITVVVGGVTIINSLLYDQGSSSATSVPSFTVPPGATYTVSWTSTAWSGAAMQWNELR